MASCAHCGSPVAAAVGGQADAPRFCCHGCAAVYAALEAAGLQEYYRLREAAPPPVDEALLGESDPGPLDPSRWVVATDSGGTVELAIRGIHCASCAWVIEEVLHADPAVRRAHVSLASERVRVHLGDDGGTHLGRLLARLARVGYSARPVRGAGSDEGEDDRRAGRLEVLRFGVAAACAMNLMLFAVSLYGGDRFGIDPSLEALFRWLSLAVATPLVGFAAWPILKRAAGAVRRGLIHVDVPIGLAIVVMYGASAVATVTGAGEIWFDSLGMLVALLLGGRLVEASVRRRAGLRLGAMLQRSEPFARRLATDGSSRPVPSDSLVQGDCLELRPGDVVPCDVRIESGRSDVDLAAVDGESRPVLRSAGGSLPAGARVLTGRLEAEVLRASADSNVERIRAAVERALEQRTDIELLADRVARGFVLAVLVVAAAVAVGWALADPSRALPVTVSVLVVACPCALALATPLAFAAALQGAAASGLVVRSGGVLLALGRVGLVAFDKTGTLTDGRPRAGRLVLTDAGAALGGDRVLRLAAAAASPSLHPVSRSVVAAAADRAPGPPLLASSFVEAAGRGVSARVDGHDVAVGRPGATISVDGTRAGRLELASRTRPGVSVVMGRLRRMGLRTALLSGDARERTEGLAASLGLNEARGEMTPADKAAWMARRAMSGPPVAFVGDGLNDAAALAVADVGLAMSGGVDLALEAADGAVTRPGLEPVAAGVVLGRRLRRVLAANITISVLYNVAAVGAAAAGLVSPLVAVLLMPVSSLVVVTYASRLARRL